MDAANVIVEQSLALPRRPIDTNRSGVLRILLDFIGQFIGDVDLEVLRQTGQLAQSIEHLETGDNRHLDARFSTLVDKLEVWLVVEKHLRDDIIGSSIDFLF